MTIIHGFQVLARFFRFVVLIEALSIDWTESVWSCLDYEDTRLLRWRVPSSWGTTIFVLVDPRRIRACQVESGIEQQRK